MNNARRSKSRCRCANHTIVGLTASLLTIAGVWSNRATADELGSKWEFQSTKDEITDETHTNMHLYGDSGSSIISIRCQEMVPINGANVPIYTLQLATSDYLGETDGLFGTRSVIYRLGSQPAVFEEWNYSDRNAEQTIVPPPANAEVLKRISVVSQIISGTTLNIRATTYRYANLDFIFEGRDTTGANEKLLQECARRSPVEKQE
jgi:hypothetical protein